MKAIEQDFPAVLFMMLHKMTLEAVNEILKCDYSNESNWYWSNEVDDHIQYLGVYYFVGRTVV